MYPVTLAAGQPVPTIVDNQWNVSQLPCPGVPPPVVPRPVVPPPVVPFPVGSVQRTLEQTRSLQVRLW